jgi:hypothetical protein
MALISATNSGVKSVRLGTISRPSSSLSAFDCNHLRQKSKRASKVSDFVSIHDKQTVKSTRGRERERKVLVRANGIKGESFVLVRVQHAAYEFDQVGV